MRLGRRPFLLSAACSLVAAPALVRAAPAPFERPGTLPAFLDNMKRAAQEVMLLDENFYAEANLKNAFAADNVVYGQPQAGFRVYGAVGGFGKLIDPVRSNGFLRDGMRLDFTLSAPENAAPEGNLRLSFAIAKRSFDDVEASFGKDWKNAPYRSPSNDPNPYSLRHRGSSSISYTLRAGPPGGWMIFSFNSWALLEQVSVANQ